MNDEKQMILEMLKEGKITVEEASALLEAIGSKKSRPENDFISKLTQSIDNVIKKTTETFSNIDLENIDINQYNLRGEINTHKEMRIEDEINKLNIDIPNGKLIIARADDAAITVTQDIWSKKADLVDYLDIDIVGDSLLIKLSDAYQNYDASAIVKIELGKNYYEDLEVYLVNGVVEVSDVDFANTNIESVNAKVSVINSQGNIEVDNVNGKVDLRNTCGNLVIDNVNGPIYLTNVSGDKAEIDAVSGSLRVDGLSIKDFYADTVSGSVRIYSIKDVETINLESASGSIVVDTDSFAGDIKARVESKNLDLSNKFKNKVHDDGVYEVSTNINKHDLKIDAEATFGKVSLR